MQQSDALGPTLHKYTFVWWFHVCIYCLLKMLKLGIEVTADELN